MPSTSRLETSFETSLDSTSTTTSTGTQRQRYLTGTTVERVLYPTGFTQCVIDATGRLHLLLPLAVIATTRGRDNFLCRRTTDRELGTQNGVLAATVAPCARLSSRFNGANRCLQCCTGCPEAKVRVSRMPMTLFLFV